MSEDENFEKWWRGLGELTSLDGRTELEMYVKAMCRSAWSGGVVEGLREAQRLMEVATDENLENNT